MSADSYNSLARTVLQGNSLGVTGGGASDEGYRPSDGTPPWGMPKYSDNVEGNDYAGIYRRTALQRRLGAPPAEAALSTYESMSGYASKRGFGVWPFDDDPPPPDPGIATGLTTVVGGGSTGGGSTGGGQNPDNCPNLPGYDPNGMSGGACNIPITPGSQPTPEQNCKMSGGKWAGGQCGCPAGFVSGGNPPSCFTKAVADLWKKGGTWQPPPPPGATAKKVVPPNPALPPSGKQASILSNPLLWVGAAVIAGGGFLAYEAHKKKQQRTMAANRRRSRRHRRARLGSCHTTTEAAGTEAVTADAVVAAGAAVASPCSTTAGSVRSSWKKTRQPSTWWTSRTQVTSSALLVAATSPGSAE